MGDSGQLFDSTPTPPGEYVRELLAERKLTQDDLATIIGRSRQAVSDVISGRAAISTDMAVALGAAFGKTANFWLAMDAAYRLSTVKEPTDAIMERARIFEIAPVKDMQKRGWLPATQSVDELPQHLQRFFETDDLNAPIQFPVAPRKFDPLSDLTPSQRAWCFRARQLSRSLLVNQFDQSKLIEVKKKLRKLAAYRNEASRLSEVLAEYGIRFVVVQPLPGAKIDGAVFWIDPSSPVIAVSIRYDRHDYFWFTVMHEFIHIENMDAMSVDDNLGREEDCALTLLKEDPERLADEGAAAALVDTADLVSFIRRVGPLYSRDRIVQFAHSIKMHPSVIVGQLQNRGEIGWHSHRDLLSKATIRDCVIETALTDGWGHTVGPDLE